MSYPATPGSVSVFDVNRKNLDDLELCAPLKLLERRQPNETAALDDDSTNLRKLVLIVRMWIAGKVLQLGMETKFTALVLLHRYWNAVDTMQPSESADDWKWVAASCIVLACKAEEEPRRLRDVINVMCMLQFGTDGNSRNIRQCHPDNTSNDFNSHPLSVADTTSISDHDATKASTALQPQSSDGGLNEGNFLLLEMFEDPPLLDDAYWKAKEQLIASEQRVLRWLHFDVIVSHPHRIVILLLRELITPTDPNNKPDQDLNDPILSCNGLVSGAWQRLNDALFYAPALAHSAMSMACVAVSLAAIALTQDTTAASSATTSVVVTQTQLIAAERERSYQPSQTRLASTESNVSSVSTADHLHRRQPPPHPVEEALLQTLRGNPTWWRRYHISDREFQDTQGDMCRATEILGEIQIR